MDAFLRVAALLKRPNPKPKLEKPPHRKKRITRIGSHVSHSFFSWQGSQGPHGLQELHGSQGSQGGRGLGGLCGWQQPSLHCFVYSSLKKITSLYGSFHSMKVISFLFLFYSGYSLPRRARSCCMSCGIGASSRTVSPVAGWRRNMRHACRAWRPISSGIGLPYNRSLIIGYPICDKCTRI